MKYYLIGFMGSGKSYLGKLWAEKYNLSFCDLDNLIEQKENTTIAHIFETKGEKYFRDLESKILKETIALENTIIACGGGTACFNDNMSWMSKNGNTIFLNPSVKYLESNILKEKNKRPLVKNLSEGDVIHYIQNKLDERLPFYSASKIILNEKDLTSEGFKIVLNEK